MSTKSKRDQARQHAESRDLARKQARIGVPPTDPKEPKSRSVSVEKEPRATPLRAYHMLMTYNEEMKDIVGEWSWHQPRDWGGEVWNEKIAPFLAQCTTKTWKEIEEERFNTKQKHIPYPRRGTIISEARKRLKQIDRDDLEELIFRFRLGNLWC